MSLCHKQTFNTDPLIYHCPLNLNPFLPVICDSNKNSHISFDSLLELIKGADAITVSDITNRAELKHGTFYLGVTSRNGKIVR